MKKYLFIMAVALAVAIFTGCSKDDEGGGSNAQFRVQVPSFVKGTSKIRVDMSVACDAAPTVTFATEGNALGVVSLMETPDFDTDYVYAGELIDVQFANGTATASFWYFPLTAGDHGVSFSASFTQNGVAKTTTSRRTLSVADAANGGFYPEVYGPGQGYYIYAFKNIRENNEGCDFRIALESLNGKKYPSPDYLTLTQGKDEITMESSTFYPIEPASWNAHTQSWQAGDILYVWVWNEDEGRCRWKASGPITFKMICRDAYNRCRDVVVTTDAQGNVESFEASDYYLWRNRK